MRDRLDNMTTWSTQVVFFVLTRYFSSHPDYYVMNAIGRF